MMNFLGLELHTTKDTFIPRPETELLVEVCLDIIKADLFPLGRWEKFKILDIGTGSGNIAVSLTNKRRDCKIVALDKSKEALALAKKNAHKFGVRDRIDFVTGDVFTGLEGGCKFDIIVSNPPYVPVWEIPTLADSVKREPWMALDGGEDGLNFYKEIIGGAPGFLKKPGYLIMEMGYNQSFYIKRLLEKAGFSDIEIFEDFSGIDRVIKAKNG